MELHRTGGVALPAGFGSALQTDSAAGGLGGTATPIQDESKKITGTSATPWLGAAGPPPLKVWQKLAILAGFLLIVFLAAGFLDR
jgi:hypothetical protein